MQENVLKELQSIKKYLAANRFGKDELWTAQDIADYLKLTPDYIRRKIIKQPNFPEPVTLQGVGTLRWIATEIKEWAVISRTKN